MVDTSQREGREPDGPHHTLPPLHMYPHIAISFLSFPDTGVDVEEAKARINSDMPGLNVIVLPKVCSEVRDKASLNPSVYISSVNSSR
jgi:hypothetical protein